MSVNSRARALMLACSFAVSLQVAAQRLTDQERRERAEDNSFGQVDFRQQQAIFQEAMRLLNGGAAKKAVAMLEELASALRPFRPAAKVLGDLYRRGQHVASSEAAAQRWYDTYLSLGNDDDERRLWLAASYCRGAPLTTGDAVVFDPARGIEILRRVDNTERTVEANFYRYQCFSRIEPPQIAPAKESLSAARSYNTSSLRNNIWNDRAAEELLKSERKERFALYDRTSALVEYESAANAGDVASQLRLYDAYSDGRGAPQNRKIAFAWAMRAAQAGDGFAQTVVGETYLYGYLPVDTNPKEAVMWLSIAATAGRQPSAAWLLSRSLAYGIGGVMVDHRLAAQWWKTCVELKGRMCKGAVSSNQPNLDTLQKTFDNK